MRDEHFRQTYYQAELDTQTIDDPLERRQRIAEIVFPSDRKDVALCKVQYQLETGNPLNLINPDSFSAKIHFIKLYDRNSLYPTLVDKYHVRTYISETIGDRYLNKLYFESTTVNIPSLSHFPETFMIKAAHGWDMNLIATKNMISTGPEFVKSTIRTWLNVDHSKRYAEWAYSKATPRILYERFLGYDPMDIKIYCFSGTPRFLKVDRHRKANQETMYLDLKWQPMPFWNPRVSRISDAPPPPTRLDEMIEIASVISRGLPFARIDLYEFERRVIFGEVTLYPSAGNIWLNPVEWNYRIGEYMVLN